MQGNGNLRSREDAEESYGNRGKKKWVGRIKNRRVFHFQASGQSLIHGTEDVIPKSGVLFREKGFISGKACVERRELGGLCWVFPCGI